MKGENLHPLTERLLPAGYKSPLVDEIITTWISKKAYQIVYTHMTTSGGICQAQVYKILGLYESEEKEPLFPYPPLVQGMPQKPKEVKEQVQEMPHWTCKCGWTFYDHDGFKYCGQCGTPRPQEKSLRERLALKLYDAWWEGRIGSPIAFESTTKEGFLREADAAISFLEQEGYKK